jgi:hypothetical protein
MEQITKITKQSITYFNRNKKEGHGIKKKI